MGDQWNENLRCHHCRRTGAASLSQVKGAYVPTVLSITDGFKVIQTEFGPDFYCRACSARAAA